VHEFFPVKKWRAVWDINPSSTAFAVRNGERSRGLNTLISSSKQEVSGIKKTGIDTIKNKQTVSMMSNCGLEVSQGIDERHQHRPSHVKSGELALGSFSGFLTAGPHY